MKVRYEVEPNGSEAVYKIVAESDLDKQLLKALYHDMTLFYIRGSTGQRHLLEIRAVRREG